MKDMVMTGLCDGDIPLLLYAAILPNVEYIKQQMPGLSQLNKTGNYKNKVVINAQNSKQPVPKQVSDLQHLKTLSKHR